MNVATNKFVTFVTLLIMTFFLYIWMIVSFFSDIGLIYTAKPLTITVWLFISHLILILFVLHIVFKDTENKDTEE